MQETNSISDLLQTIQSFQIVKCNMHHEKVRTDADGNLIYRTEDDHLFFDRVNLCDPKIRNWRLGCAHSKVNINFERFLEHVLTELPQKTNQILDLKTQFKAVISKIYNLDHKVGHLEHDLAVSALTSDNNNNESLMTSMSGFKIEHRRLMDCLSKIKSDIEQLIKSEINYNTL